MIHYNERWLTIHWDDSIQAVWMEWKSYWGGSALGSMRGFRFIRQKQACRCRRSAAPGAGAAGGSAGPTTTGSARHHRRHPLHGTVLPDRRGIAPVGQADHRAKVRDIELVTCNFDDLEQARAGCTAEQVV